MTTSLSEKVIEIMNDFSCYVDMQGQYIYTDTANGYFELYINEYHRIETITVLSKQVRAANERNLLPRFSFFL